MPAPVSLRPRAAEGGDDCVRQLGGPTVGSAPVEPAYEPASGSFPRRRSFRVPHPPPHDPPKHRSAAASALTDWDRRSRWQAQLYASTLSDVPGRVRVAPAGSTHTFPYHVDYYRTVAAWIAEAFP